MAAACWPARSLPRSWGWMASIVQNALDLNIAFLCLCMKPWVVERIAWKLQFEIASFSQVASLLMLVEAPRPQT